MEPTMRVAKLAPGPMRRHMTRGVATRSRRSATLRMAVLMPVLMALSGPPAHARDSDDKSIWSFCLPPQDAEAGSPFVLRLAGIFRAKTLPGMPASDPLVFMESMPGKLRIAIERAPGAGPLSGLAALILGGAPAPKPATPPIPAATQPAQQTSAVPASTPAAPTAVDLNGTAVQHLLAGRFEQAQQVLEECLAAVARQADVEAEGACSGNLGVALAMQGRLVPAREQFERSRQRYADWADALKPPAPANANPMRTVLDQARLEQGRRFAPVGIARAWLNLGSLAAEGGQLQQAEAALQRALATTGPLPNPPGCNAAAANDLARLYRRLGREPEADAVLRAETTGGAGGVEPTMYMAYLAPGALSMIGAKVATANPAGNNLATALGLMSPEPLGRRGEQALQQAQTDAQQRERAGPPDDAVRAYARLALLAAATRRPELEATAHTALMKLQAGAAQPAAATYHGKLAVNLLQGMRSGLESAPAQRETQRAYLRDRAAVYTRLAQLLLDTQRLGEAEQVLRLLKEDEGQQFAAAGRIAAHATLPMREAEAQAQARFTQLATQLREADEARNRAVEGSAYKVPGYSPLGIIDLKQVEQGRLAVVQDPGTLERQFATLKEAYQSADDERRKQPLAGVLIERMLAPNVQSLVDRLEHLAEDAPKFTTVRASPQQLASIATQLQRLRALQASRPKAPPTTDLDAEAGRAGELLGQMFASRGAALVADPMEQSWRGNQAMQEAEDKHQRDEAEAPARLTTAMLAAGPAATTADDSARLLSNRAPRTALLHYLPGDDRLDLLLTTAQGRRTWRLPIGRAALDRQVGALQAALRDRSANPLPPARALYDSLLAPVASALEQAGATQLVLSLSGSLRFVPFAALHDGRQWLVERYALALHPGARLAEAMQPASRHWQVAAFGASQGGAGLHPLPSVRQELASVLRQATGAPGSPQGAMPGRGWLDRDFNAQALRSALGGASGGTPGGASGGAGQVLHIASHFAFKPGDATASFLLLGDGTALSLEKLGGPDYRFDRTELVTLSACETGLSEADSYGQEVDGLAALLMARGAPSVLASLWRVEDDSTARLMGSLYRLHQDERQALTRAEALRQAQLDLVRSADPSAAAASAAATGAPDGPQRGIVRPGTTPGGPGRALGLAHPYYWAPFVLMGAWL